MRVKKSGNTPHDGVRLNLRVDCTTEDLTLSERAKSYNHIFKVKGLRGVGVGKGVVGSKG